MKGRQVTGDDILDRVSHAGTCHLDDDVNEGTGKVDRIAHSGGVQCIDTRIYDVVPH
jgi:hypothetical protein